MAGAASFFQNEAHPLIHTGRLENNTPHNFPNVLRVNRRSVGGPCLRFMTHFPLRGRDPKHKNVATCTGVRFGAVCKLLRSQYLASGAVAKTLDPPRFSLQAQHFRRIRKKRLSSLAEKKRFRIIPFLPQRCRRYSRDYYMGQ